MTITKEQLINAGIDAQTLDDFVNGAEDINGNGIITSRLGASLRSLSKITSESNTIISLNEFNQVSYGDAYVTAEEVYKKINNLPNGGCLSMRYLGNEDILTSRINNLFNKRVQITIQGGSGLFIIDRTIKMEGGFLHIGGWDSGASTVVIRVNTACQGVGTLALGGFYSLNIKTDLNTVVVFKHPWHQDTGVAQSGDVILQMTRCNWTREDGTSFSEENPLDITFTSRGDLYGHGWIRHKVSGSLNGATTEQVSKLGVTG